jgi:hypothetical protein
MFCIVPRHSGWVAFTLGVLDSGYIGFVPTYVLRRGVVMSWEEGGVMGCC